jgi:hypothetical protein
MKNITERAKKVRAALDAAGYSAKDVTSRVAFGNVIRVTIQRLGIKFAAVEKTVRPFEVIPRDPNTGALLLRGEIHVWVGYNDKLIAKLRTAAKRLLSAMAEGTRIGVRGFNVARLDANAYVIDGGLLTVPLACPSPEAAFIALARLVAGSGGTSVP